MPAEFEILKLPSLTSLQRFCYDPIKLKEDDTPNKIIFHFNYFVAASS